MQLRALVGSLTVIGLLSVAILVAGRPDPAPAEAPPPSPLPPTPELAPAPAEPTWQGVDLDAVRAALPDNAYWTLGLPTDDPAVLAARRADAEARNTLYGKVLSGNADQAEIDAYYDERQRVSEDYVALCEHVLAHYGAEMSERDAGLVSLALELNRGRLDQLPDERARARDRRIEQERARTDWESTRGRG